MYFTKTELETESTLFQDTVVRSLNSMIRYGDNHI